jgi:hypothetical protein
MGDASNVEKPVNYDCVLPGACAAGDGGLAHELRELTHFFPPMR